MTKAYGWPGFGRRVVAAALATGVAVGACGGGNSATKPTTAPEASPASPLAAAVASATPVRDAAPPEEEAEASAPPTADAGSTGIPECDRYLEAIDRIVACDSVPEDQRDSMREMGREQRQLLEILGDPAIREQRRKSASDACRRGAASLDQAFASGVCGAAAGPDAATAPPP
jgi:predicted component of type VI protein secretion system